MKLSLLYLLISTRFCPWPFNANFLEICHTYKGIGFDHDQQLMIFQAD